ncbi:unnamed protein product [Amoebophrya sp. A120]|nr:unnamed protein product [Amoebophrya sp. A120]|eukprot:GSA120T00020029001.1
MLVSSPVVPEMKKSPSKGSSPSKTPSKNRNKTLDEDLENDNETNMQLLASFTWPQSLENNEGADEDKEQKVLNESTNNCGVNSVCFSGRSNYILATASSTLRILNRKTGDVVAEYEHENLTTDQDNPAAAGAEIPKITTLTLDADCDNCFIGDTDGIIHCLTVGEFLHAMGNESKKRSKEYVSGATPLSSKQNSKQREVAEGLFGSSGGKAVAGSAEDLASKTLLTGGN